MKRLTSMLLALCMAVGLTSAFAGNVAFASNDDTWKIAVVTNTVSQNEEEYRSAQQLVEKYGEDKIVHVTWPDNFMNEQEQMVSIVQRLASDDNIKALVINQAVPGSNAAVDKLLEDRDDMFIAYCTPGENPPDVAKRANLILQPDELKMGYTIPEQAQKLGAKTLVHYSFPRHMSYVLLAARRDILKSECERLGIEFVDATAPDPTSDAGLAGAQQFILEDVPKMVDKYGEDTAFFSTNCSMQVPLIKAVVDTGAIYPVPCCPSPYHGFPTALGLETGDELGDIDYVIAETTKILAEKDMLGRLSTWPVPVSMMATSASVEYAIRWINGDVDKEGIDVEALEKCMAEYAGLPVSTETYEEESEDGEMVAYDNYRLVTIDYYTYEALDE